MPETQEAPKPAEARPAEPPPEKKQRKPFLFRRLFATPVRAVVVLVMITLVAGAGWRIWIYMESYEDTDDAQIDGDIYPITSRIAGTIKNIYVENNAKVQAGQLLSDIDPRDFEVAVEQARAAVHEAQTQVTAAQPNVPITTVTTQTTVTNAASELAAARAQLAAAQREYDSALADVRSAEADNARAQSDLARYKQLVAKDEISQQQYDQALAAAQSAAANVEAKRATAEAGARNIEAAQSRVEQAITRQQEAERTRPEQLQLQQATVATRQATTQVQQAGLNKAELNLSYTKIFSPIAGIVGRRGIGNGEQVSAGQQLMVVVPVEGLWVSANFKETQLKRMRPGLPATIHVDAFDRDYSGHVADIAGASGARFSLLPPENATGNYVKVVQRVPVRIEFDPGQDPDHKLRQGMSVEPRVWLNGTKKSFWQALF